MSRVPLSRWARIGVWTGAAVAWGSSLVLIRESAPTTATPNDPVPEPVPAQEVEPTASAMPALPDRGLVVLRYTPIAEPEPEIITRYVTVQASPSRAPSTAVSSGAGSGGSSGSSTVAAPPPPAVPTVTTAAPAPASGGS